MATLISARRIIIKIGSALLVDQETGTLNTQWLSSLAQDVAHLRSRGKDVILVSSGAIALGRRVLGFAQDELSLEQSQAAASVGQIILATAYSDLLSKHNLKCGQVLLTLDDSANRRRYLNSRATLETLLIEGVVPIVNENDTVATDEIRFGDNDRMAAQVAVTVGADCLVLLSDVDGFYSENPNLNSNAQRFDVIDKITPEIEEMAGDPVSGLSKGGMRTKIMAAQTATQAGCAMVITLGSRLYPITELENGANATWFSATLDPQTARKAWIMAMKPQGDLVVDTGAAQALHHGKSLLPAGVIEVSGAFERGDPVRIVLSNGEMIAQGLIRYDRGEAQRIMGKKSSEIVQILGYDRRAALVHRDDMAALEG